MHTNGTARKKSEQYKHQIDYEKVLLSEISQDPNRLQIFNWIKKIDYLNSELWSLDREDYVIHQLDTIVDEMKRFITPSN